MQTVIYADVLVALNTVLTYLLLCAASAVSRVPNRTLGTVAASLLGGASSLIVFVDLPAAASVAYRVGTAALLTFLAFLPKKPKSFLKTFAAFFGAGFLFGGAMLAVEWAFHPAGMLYQSGAIYFCWRCRSVCMGCCSLPNTFCGGARHRAICAKRRCGCAAAACV